jgi:hypothetical protein
MRPATNNQGDTKMAPLPSRTYEVYIERDGKRYNLMLDTTDESRAKVLAQVLCPGGTVLDCRFYDEALHQGKRLLRVGEFWWMYDKMVRVLRVSGLRSLLLVIDQHKEHTIRDRSTQQVVRTFRSPVTIEGSPYCEDFRKPTETEQLAALEAVEKGEAMKQQKKTANGAKAPKQPQDCGCGCGGKTGGGRFLPGHDAKLKGRLIREARDGNKPAVKALKDLGWEKYVPTVEPKKAKKAPAEKLAPPATAPESAITTGEGQ